MSISQISNFNQNGITGSSRVEITDDTRKELRIGGDVERQDFSELVKDFAKDVNDLQFQAGHAIDMLVTGRQPTYIKLWSLLRRQVLLVICCWKSGTKF